MMTSSWWNNILDDLLLAVREGKIPDHYPLTEEDLLHKQREDNLGEETSDDLEF